MTLAADRAIAGAERWPEVEEAIQRWRDLGISATGDDVETTYIDSMLGLYPERSRNEIVDDLLEATET